MTVAAVVAALLASLFLLTGPARPASAEVLETTATMTCVGGTEQAKAALELLDLDPPGTVIVQTDVTATVPDGDLLQNKPYDVEFSWSFTIPPELVEVAESFKAEIFLQDMELGVTASGAATASWAFPEIYPADGGPMDLEDPSATLVTGGQMVPDAQGEITYTLDTPATLTVFVPSTPENFVPVDIPVVLDCDFTGNTIGTSTVNGIAEPPAPPTGVMAEAGPGQASVSWTAPVDTGDAPLGGYIVETGEQGILVGPEVTSIDYIGLAPGSEHSFTVIAWSEIGQSEPSEPSATVTIEDYGFEFGDVPEDHAFFAEIQWMAETGLSTGYPDGTYLPNGTLSRQAMSAFLYRMAGQPADPTCTEAPFSDVPVDHPFCGEIAWLASTGITTGYPDGTFHPAAGLSREAMSAFLYRAAGSVNGPDPQCTVEPFTDVPVTNAFCGEITWMADVGISEGYPDGTYAPAATLTRQAMSAFLYRFTLVSPGIVVPV